MQLSEHFTLEEMERSNLALRKGIDNSAPPEVIPQLIRLCTTLLEPARSLLGVPFHTDSGYRCPILNTLVGSTATHSAHLDGRAADVIPMGMDLRAAFDKIRASAIPFDQILIECGAWLHLAVAKEGEKARLMAMTASGGPGHWVYNYV